MLREASERLVVETGARNKQSGIGARQHFHSFSDL